MTYRSTISLLLAMAVWCVASSPGAQDLVLDKHLISAGGNTVSGGPFVLRSSTGQVISQTSAGRGFLLTSGFWVPSSTPETTDVLFQDGFETTTSN